MEYPDKYLAYFSLTACCGFDLFLKVLELLPLESCSGVKIYIATIGKFEENGPFFYVFSKFADMTYMTG